MSEQTGSDQGERRSGAELVPATPDWDALFSPGEGAAAPPREPSANSDTPRVWLKAATPLLVLLAYFAIKLFPTPGAGGNSYWSMPKAPSTLTGVAPAGNESIAVDRATGAFLAELERSAQRNEWAAIRNAIAAQAEPAIREHPVVAAFAVLARARGGERNVAVEGELATSAQRVAAGGARYANLVEELNLARAEQILARSADPDILSLNLDTLYALLGATADSPRNLDVRLRAARLLEAFGDDAMAAARGYLQDDVVKIRQARALYQHALRFLVRSDRWLELQPVSPRATAPIEVIVEKMRACNRAIHGPSLPFTRYDSTTWSGEKGRPVHDAGTARR